MKKLIVTAVNESNRKDIYPDRFTCNSFDSSEDGRTVIIYGDSGTTFINLDKYNYVNIKDDGTDDQVKAIMK